MLTLEWRRRINHWKDSLHRMFYTPLGSIFLEGFTTKGLLTLNEALDGNFKPMPQGAQWGNKWEYAWFKGEITLPTEVEGKFVVLKLDVGAESTVYINSVSTGAIDKFHKEITLSRCAHPDRQFQVVIEAYAGHGPQISGGGPCEYGREMVPEPAGLQAVVGNNTFGVWNEDCYQLFIDIDTLLQIRDNIDPDSLRVSEIDEALKKMTLTVDPELPIEDTILTVKQSREELKPLLACVNGSTTPTMFVFGHSHIDVAWLWPLAETEKKCTRTFSTQLSLMEEYPEFKFLQSQAHLYIMVKDKYPDLYARIKEAAGRGQFIPDGGMWVEPDTNIAGGESLIRQFIHGKRFFKEEFGVDSRMCWLPDVFGYSGAFPQIMKGCEIDYFSTQKIFWTYNGGAAFPYNTFWWEGIDGTKVLSHIHNDYNAQTTPSVLIQRWKERVQKNGLYSRLFPFGWGDGGGGPERNHLEYLRRCENLEGVPKTKMCHPIDFFQDLEKHGIPDIKYVGELYFQAHRGTYTSQAKTKKGNRKSEFALREAELWSVIANKVKNQPYDYHELDTLWKKLLLNQFHDILPGSSIQRVYEEAEADFAQVIQSAGNLAKTACRSLSSDKDGITVFNSLSFENIMLVPIPITISEEYVNNEQLCDDMGNILDTQNCDGRIYVEVKVPPVGYTSIKEDYSSVKQDNTCIRQDDSSVHATLNSLENNFIKITLNQYGEITSIFNKASQRETVAGICNQFNLYKDVPNYYDAWDIDSMYIDQPVITDRAATLEVIAQGPLFAGVRVTRKLNNSFVRQDIILGRNSCRVDFKTSIDWKESHKLLKVNFPVKIHAIEACHEIQFGYIKRPNHFSQELDANRFEVSQHKWTALYEEDHGIAVLNDCKYGVNVYENSINLTLLKSALAPDMSADKGVHEFTYSLYTWEGNFKDSRIVQEGYALNLNPVVVNGYTGTGSFMETDCSNVVIDTVKLAEDGSGDIIIRMYESMHMSTQCRLKVNIPFSQAIQTNMLEKREQELQILGKDIVLSFRPFEIKTVRLTDSFVDKTL